MPLSALLDSVILIDHFNGIAEATAYLGRVRRNASVTMKIGPAVPLGRHSRHQIVICMLR